MLDVRGITHYATDMAVRLPLNKLTLAEKAALLKSHKISIRAFAREIGKSHVTVLEVLSGKKTSQPIVDALDAYLGKLLKKDAKDCKRARKSNKKGK